MAFLSICTALYDYTPQSDNELDLKEGELIYILEKSGDDDWWKAKKRASGGEEDEPVGLIPNNYVEKARATCHAKALYDYTRQTDEELSFSEDSALSVYDTSDPDWTLVGLNGEFGFAPANYIEISEPRGQRSPVSAKSPELPPRDAGSLQPSSPNIGASSPSGAASVLVGIMRNQASGAGSDTPRSRDSPPPKLSLPRRRPQYTPEDSDEEQSTLPTPSLPQRPPSQQLSPPLTQHALANKPESPGIAASPPYNRVVSQSHDGARNTSGGFHLYNINEMVSALGKKKKMPTTLGLNLATGNIMIAPEKSRDGPQQEWTAEKLTHYSMEGKHVFMELVRPSKSIDFHAGAKDTAQEIVSGLSEIAGAARAEGLREVLAASAGSGGGQKKGRVLYDFMAQGDDEVTIAVDDEVIIIDDKKSDEWWMVRRLKNGKEGVVPSSYIEDLGMTAPLTDPALMAARSTVEQNRFDEERLAKEATKSTKSRGGDGRSSEVGPGVKLPERGSSLAGPNDGNQEPPQRSKREIKSHGRTSSSSKSKPDTTKTRIWTDRSGSFKVEAEFIGLKDGKIHLHKLNGVKIAVHVAKMAVEDLEYVERVTGVSLDDEKPLSEIRRRSLQAASKEDRQKLQTSSSTPSVGTLAEKPKPPEAKTPDYDWFEFFLKAGVNPYQCERYAFNFHRDSMGEAILSEITPSVLRILGLKEGDILRVTKYLDTQYGRVGANSKLRTVSFGDEELKSNDDGSHGNSPTSTGGGLFSGPGGALRNNTGKGRPAPPVQNDDIVDAETFRRKGIVEKKSKSSLETARAASIDLPGEKSTSGFDDDAWDVKPSRKPNIPQPTSSTSTPTAAAPAQPILTGAMAELSLLSEPLQPTVLNSPGVQKNEQAQSRNVSQPTAQSSVLVANPTFLSQAPQQLTGPQPQQQVFNQPPPPINPNNQSTYQSQQPGQQKVPPRQRPHAPQITQQGSLILPPPPARPLSAPQNASQVNGFGAAPLQPHLTGAQNSTNIQNPSAPVGQSLNELDQFRYQQQYSQQQLYPKPTGFGQQNQTFSQFGGGMPIQRTGFGQQMQMPPQPSMPQNSQQFLLGQQTGSPFADPRPQQPMGGFLPLVPQMTGYPPPAQGAQQTSQLGSINAFLPPALQPQSTGASQFGAGTNGFANRPAFGQPPPSMPPSSLQPPLAPLQLQKTGPAPPVRFGVGEAKKLVPQATGRKANLSQATPQNPFGF